MDTINIKRKRHHNFYCSKYNGEPQLYSNDQTQFGSNSVSYYPSNKKSISRFTQLSTFVGNCTHSELIHLTSEIERLLKRNFLADLPYEIAQKVLKYLTPKDLLQCCKVSKAWLLVSQDALLWQNLCKKYDCSSLTADSVVMGGSWKELFLKQNQLNCNWRRGTKTPPKLLFGHENHVITCLEVYKDWAISGSDDSSICVWDLISCRRLTTLFGHIGGVWSMTVLPPATDLHNNENDCLHNIPLLISGSTDRTARIWRLDNSSWACIATLFGHHSTVRCLAGQALGCSTFSSLNSECTEYHQSDESCKTYQRLDIQSTGAGDRLFVSGSRDTTLRLWSASTGHCIHILRGHRGAVRCVQFCGVHIVSGSYDCKIRVWCAVSGSCLRVLRHHTDRVYTLLFDGVRIISGSLDTKIRIWNVITGSLDQTLCGHQSLTSEMVLDAKYERLITSNADETIRVWSLNDGQCLHVLAGHNKHQSAVTCVQVTSNFIVSSSDDGTVKLWDRISGEYIRDLICLDSATAGGVVWRIGVTYNRVVCAAGSRCGTETTKLIVLRFDDESDLVPNHCCQSQHLSYPPLKLSQLFYDYLRHKVPCIEASGLLLTGQNDANNPHSIPVCCATADLSQRRDTRTDLSVDFRLPSAILNFYPSP